MDHYYFDLFQSYRNVMNEKDSVIKSGEKSNWLKGSFLCSCPVYNQELYDNFVV